MRVMSMCGLVLIVVIAPPLLAQQTGNPYGQVTVSVTSTLANNGANWTYSYDVAVMRGSTRSLSGFGVKLAPLTPATVDDTPLGWLSVLRPGEPVIAAWTALSRGIVAPGRSSGRFAITAPGLPGIVDAYALGLVPPQELPKCDNECDHEAQAALPLSSHGRAIRLVGPVPDSPSPLAVKVQGIVELLNEALALEWMDRSGVAHSLQVKLLAAAASLERGDNRTARNQLNAFLTELKAQTEKHVSPSAAAMLRANVEYALSKV